MLELQVWLDIGIATSADAFLNNGIQPNMLLLLMQRVFY
jgi:hypothetical protein